MNSDLQNIIASSTSLSSRSAEYRTLLSSKREDPNRLKAFYELLLLAKVSLETASQIDFSGFLDSVQAEIHNIQEVSIKAFEDNRAHYKWSDDLVKHLLSDSMVIDSGRIKQLSDEIRERLEELDQLLSAAMNERNNRSFESLK